MYIKISILQSLQERAVKREQRQNAKQNNEKTQWKKFWEDYGRKLLVHACSSRSSRALDSVKVLISITKSIPSLVVDPRWEFNVVCVVVTVMLYRLY